QLSGCIVSEIGLNTYDFEVSDGVKAWLEEAARRSVDGWVNPRELLIDIWDRLPADFRPSEVDTRLFTIDSGTHQGGRLTLLGHYLLDPRAEVIENCDRVIRTIRDHLIAKPDSVEIDAHFVADRAKLGVDEVQYLFLLLREIGSFWSGASGDRRGRYTTIRCDSEDVLLEYLMYEGIHEHIRKYVRKTQEGQAGPFRSAGYSETNSPIESAWTGQAFI